MLYRKIIFKSWTLTTTFHVISDMSNWNFNNLIELTKHFRLIITTWNQIWTIFSKFSSRFVIFVLLYLVNDVSLIIDCWTISYSCYCYFPLLLLCLNHYHYHIYLEDITVVISTPSKKKYKKTSIPIRTRVWKCIYIYDTCNGRKSLNRSIPFMLLYLS